MRGPSAAKLRWLLCSDIHFNHSELDRVRQTGEWIVAEAERHQVKRAVVCGDLLTSRTKQDSHVLSECFNFVNRLIDVVPQVHILLGNHDLSHRHEYQATALNAFNSKRLAEYVTLHSNVTHQEWDGRRVLLLPFREEQHELVEAVAAMSPDEASKTVAFAHLAIHKAITQRYKVHPGTERPRTASSTTHLGLTGPDRFASLTRTFTGHFHSHQTIHQRNSSRSNDPLRGSITYLGSPLQLTWADLWDEQRGVVLFDPETLEHEMLINPHAVAYTTVKVQEVLNGKVNEGAVAGKNVMLLGKLTRPTYNTARDKLLSLGVRGVREWSHTNLTLRADRSSLSDFGASVPASDIAVQLLEEPAKDEVDPNLITEDDSGDPLSTRLDLTAEARKYVERLDLDELLQSQRDELVRVGQRIIQISPKIADQDDELELDYRDFLDGSSNTPTTKTAAELPESSTSVFVAEPRTLTITNFLGVHGTISIDFTRDFPRGLTFLIGKNGSGKSTIVEAMVWCQFGSCIRKGLLADDVVNDKAGKNCSVSLEFANGYTISRYRKHKTHKGRVVVTLHGEPKLQLERPTKRATQLAIDELLGTDLKTYLKTVVLSHESAASFLTSRPSEQRSQIEASLGLSVLDQCRSMSKSLLSSIDDDIREVKSNLEGMINSKQDIEQRLEYLCRKQKEAEKHAASLKVAIQSHTAVGLRTDDQENCGEDHARFGDDHPEFNSSIVQRVKHRSVASKGPQDSQRLISAEELCLSLRSKVSTLQGHASSEEENIKRLENSLIRIQGRKCTASKPWLVQLQQQLYQKLESLAATSPSGLRKTLHVVNASVLHFCLTVVKRLLSIRNFPAHGSQGASAQDHDQEAAANDLRNDIKKGKSRLERLKNDSARFTALEKLAASHAAMVKEELKQASEATEVYEAVQHQIMLKQHEAATYKDLIEKDQSPLHSKRLECERLATQLRELTADRELFAFWHSALAKRSASSSSAKSTANPTVNFREHIISKSLSELNTVFAQVLEVLFNDTNHARVMTTGLLSSLFNSETDETMFYIPSSSGSAPNETLAVHPSLIYGKLSAGQRKRIDLALFFAQSKLDCARSAHRAHYLLIDEVFDSLDDIGQEAVVKWCEVMSQTMVGWVVVITHSKFLAAQNLREDANKAWVVGARMGHNGTELTADGRRIGFQDQAKTPQEDLDTVHHVQK